MIDTYYGGEVPSRTNLAVWYLGRSIKLMSEADYFIGVRLDESSMFFNGCSDDCWRLHTGGERE